MNDRQPALRQSLPPSVRAETTLLAPVYLRNLMAEARQRGIPSHHLLRGVGFSATDLDMPGFQVSHREATVVLQQALQQMPSAHLGLTLGLRSRLTDRGSLALGLLASANLGQAIDLCLRHPRSAGHLVGLHQERQALQHLLVAEPLFDDPELTPFLVDMSFASAVRQLRLLAGAAYAPLAVELTRPHPAEPAVYQRAFHCPVHFGSSGNRLVSDLAWLEVPLPLASLAAARLAAQWLEREPSQAVSSSAFGLSVERLIRTSLPRLPTPASVSLALHVSERTLRRTLAAEGTSYAALLDASRQARAMELLLHGDMPIAEVAEQVAFADARSLRRAMRRWADQSASSLRASAKSAQARPPAD